MKIIIHILVFLALCILLGCVAITRPSLTTYSSYNPEHTVSPEALSAHVQFLSETCLPRDHENTLNLNKAANYIENAFSQSADQVELQTYVANNYEYKNVIGFYGPESDEVFIVGAHYDAFMDFPGADDNASGVAGLIELGKLLSKASLQSQIILVAYTLEEPPYFRTENMGSAVHAQSLISNKVKVKLMISLEMIGYFSEVEGSQEFPNPIMRLLYPDRGNYIAVVDQMFTNNAHSIKQAINTYTDLPAYSINAPKSIPGIDFSDHMSYWNNSYPAVMITDTAFYRNKNYHTPEDTYDKLNYEKMSQVVYGVFKYLQDNTDKSS